MMVYLMSHFYIAVNPGLLLRSFCLQRAEEEVQHHSRAQAGDREGERAGDHRQRKEADPRSGPGLLQELAGSSRDLPELQLLVISPGVFLFIYSGGFFSQRNVTSCTLTNGGEGSRHFIMKRYK